ncbi:MAG: hypothetical protein U1D55_05725 [Phycisphaerae bacterium]
MAKRPVRDAGASATRTEVRYQANRDGSPAFAEPQSGTMIARADNYTYDGLHRLSTAKTGLLSSSSGAMLGEWTDPGQLAYTMDILGNFTQIDRKNSGTSALGLTGWKHGPTATRPCDQRVDQPVGRGRGASRLGE